MLRELIGDLCGWLVPPPSAGHNLHIPNLLPSSGFPRKLAILAVIPYLPSSLVILFASSCYSKDILVRPSLTTPI